MSLPEQEIRAMQNAWRFLLDLSGGQEKRIPSVTRERARDIVKHYPYPGSIEEFWKRWPREDVS